MARNYKVFTKFNMVFILCLLLIIINAIYWGSQKEGFYGDELYSYAFISSTDEPSVNWGTEDSPYLNAWQTPEHFWDFFLISPEERYDVGGVLRVIKGDDHPPRFYLLLELLISTFSVNSFNKWMGLSINLICYILSLVLLYILAKQLIGSKKWALLAMVFYGFSISGVSNFVYIRMYMMLTLATLAFVLANLIIIDNYQKIEISVRRKWGSYVFYAYTVFYGLTTQCQFAVYCGFFGCMVFIYALIKRKWKFSFEYAAFSAAGLLLTAIVWSETYHDIFAGDDATQQAFTQIFTNSEFWNNLRKYWSIINEQVFSGLGLPLIIALILLGIASCIRTRRRQLTNGERIHKRFVIVVLVVTILYILLMVQIAPMQIDRYVFNVYPILILLLVYFGYDFVSCFTSSKQTQNIAFIIAAVLCIFVVILGYTRYGVNYIYPGTEQKVAIMKEKSDVPVIMVTKDNRRYFSCVNSYYVKDSDRVFPVMYDEIGRAIVALKGLNRGEKDVIIYIDPHLENEDDILNYFEQNMNEQERELLFSTDEAQVYYLF